MCRGAASASSMEHSSGSVFMSQYFIGIKNGVRPQFSHYRKWGLTPILGCPPLVPVGPAPEPWLNRVVAYRSHQVHPACARHGTIATVTLDPRPEEAIGSEILSPVVHSRGHKLKPTAAKRA